MNTHRMRDRVASGFSLIELLVSMVIALVVTLAITSVLVRSEGGKRSTTSVNDVNQTGAYAAFVMDRSIRSAGSGYGQNWADSFGCVIDASKNGATILPLPGALDPPFALVPLRVRLAPILIGKGMADTGAQVRGDVITVMAGMSGASDQPQAVSSTSPPSTVRMTNTLGYQVNDLLLLADQGLTANPLKGCMLQQVASAAGSVAADQVALAGAEYSRDNGTVVGLGELVSSTNPIAIQMGTVPAAAGAPSNPPQMLLYGVGDNNTLSSFDLLHVGVAANNRAPTPIADGVVEMRALYGVDTVSAALGNIPDGQIDTWIDPGNAAAGYTFARLTQGDNVAQGRLRRIAAVRIGLILRTSLRERDAIPAGTSVTLFGDLPAALQQTRTLAGEELFYRFRTVEFTVPLRNPLYAPSVRPDGSYPPAS
jgi:type IV pilus assembly protein PilW